MTLLLRFLALSVSSLALLVALILLIFDVSTAPYIDTNTDTIPKAYTAIVLGAGILQSGELSTILKDRVDVAATLYEEGKVDTILVTGDDGTSTHNEVNPAREYLLAEGVPSSAIYLDHAGFDTYSSMYRAKQIFKVETAIIVTQSFHLPRSVFIARSLGIDAYGVPADQHTYHIRNNLRELLANVKAVIDLIRYRQPKYLGDTIPITGDSSLSI